jgi:ubiquinone/menaquinone biosynthesis C-methylase UbiE
MNLEEAISFIRPGVKPLHGTWADIGAGTGVFTQAMMHILEEGRVIALDKNPHLLYSLKSMPHVHLSVVEGDFNHALALPPLDGIIMANALHYATDHETVLKNVLTSLKKGGRFILIEYDTEVPNHPWVPYPVSLTRYRKLCKQIGLSEPELIGTRDSIYQDGIMYAVLSVWI